MADVPGFDRERLAQPIPGDEPSGEWLRRAGTYAEVQEAIRVEAGDPAYGIPEKAADWELASRLCLEALSEKTKDFYLATILVEALTGQHGAPGLGEGLWLVATLHERFWSDFHPRPRDEGTNFDGRLNQLEALVRSMPRILDSVAMGDAEPVLTWGEWRTAGGSLPGGSPSPVAPEQRDQLAGASSWDFYDASVRGMRTAVAELARFDDLLDGTYPSGAPSLSELKESLAELAGVLERQLAGKGPGPHQTQAQEILNQTGATFLAVEWLGEHFRSGISLPRALNSVQAAVHDERAGLAPEQGWQALLDEHWARGESYERRSEEPAAPAVPEPAAPPEMTPDAAPSAAPSPTPVAAPPVAAAPVVASAPVGGDALGALVGACRALRASDPASPVPYLTLRHMRWSELARLEAGDAVPGPGGALRSQLQALFDNQDWAPLVEQCELALEQPTTAAWLDLQRFVCAGMRQVGLPLADVPRERVIDGLSDLLRRKPWLLEVNLADGQPAADEITRNWIRAEVLGESVDDDVTADGDGGRSGGPAAPLDATALAIAEARRLFEADGLEAGTAHLQVQLSESRSGRQRALIEEAIAGLLLDGGHPDLALPILESLRETLTSSLPPARWEEPDFLARTLEALYHGYSASTGQDADAEGQAARRVAVANELARIDPIRRLRLDTR